jgi:hypothetical protein
VVGDAPDDAGEKIFAAGDASGLAVSVPDASGSILFVSAGTAGVKGSTVEEAAGILAGCRDTFPAIPQMLHGSACRFNQKPGRRVKEIRQNDNLSVTKAKKC